MRLAPQHRCQIEPEAVDMHLLDPIAQAVQHHPQHRRLRQIQRVAGACIIGIIAPAMIAAQLVLYKQPIGGWTTLWRAEVLLTKYCTTLSLAGNLQLVLILKTLPPL